MPIVTADSDSIRGAADVLRRGGVAAFPTETVYGLGADTFNESALARVYELKGRPFDNPLIAHVLDIEQARRIVLRWDERCEALASRFWPGPLTIVVAKHDSVPKRATAGYPTIAVRSPAHGVARQLLKAFGGPISAPSANRSGHVSPTRASHVADDFAEADDLVILDGGSCDIGIESTVLELPSREEQPRVLRPGSVSAEQIGEALGSRVAVVEPHAQAASPGTAVSHYAPRTSAELVDGRELAARLAGLQGRAIVLAMPGVDVAPPHGVMRMPEGAEEYAARLYETLRAADARTASCLLIEKPEGAGPLWDAIRDRLRRATGDRGGAPSDT